MRNLLLLTSAVVFFDTLFFSALTPLLPHFADELSLGKTGAGVLAAAYPAGAFLGAIPSGILAARFGLKLSVLVGMTTVAICTVLFGLSQEAWQLDLARFLQGVASAFTWTGALGWLVAAAPAANRGAADRHGRSPRPSRGALFGPVVGGVASVAGIGWTFGALAAASFGLVAWAALDTFRRLRRAAGSVGARSAPSATARSSAPAGSSLLPALLFGTLSVLAPLRLSALGFGAVAIGAVFLCSAALEAVNNVFLGHVSDRLGPVVPLAAGLVASTVVAALAALAGPGVRARSARRLRRARVRHVLHAGNDAALEPGRVARTSLRLRRRVDQPRVGARANARRRRGRRARTGDERRGAVPPALGRLRRDARPAAAGAPDARLGYASRLRAVKKVLVANRGEIALRVFRAARELGLGTVAVVAPDDARLAARALGRRDRRDRLLPRLRGAHPRSAARRAPTRSIPATGSWPRTPTSPRRSRRPASPGSGRRAEALRRGGDKLEAKRIAAEAGVPTVPEATEPPLIVKAAAGGGGRGMRDRPLTPRSSTHALDAARREAQAGFGDDRVYLERYLERPRHVEIQLLADTHGTVLALGERECSVQRRHQKVLEESPSTALDPELRAQMSDAAVRFATAIGYVGAGTAEFVLEGREFFFLELNGRIQVEHPVTEAVTGIDLVQWQLRIARGERLDVDAAAATAPPSRCGSTPRIRARFCRRPGASSGCGCRRRSASSRGVAEGDEVGIAYDPMIAKLIASGATRDEALDRLAAALAETEVGRRHDEPAVPALARRASRRVRAGETTTAFLTEYPPLSAPPARCRPTSGATASGSTCRRRRSSPRRTSTRRRSTTPGAGRAAHGRRADAGHGDQGQRSRRLNSQSRRAARRTGGDEDGDAAHAPRTTRPCAPCTSRKAIVSRVARCWSSWTISAALLAALAALRRQRLAADSSSRPAPARSSTGSSSRTGDPKAVVVLLHGLGQDSGEQLEPWQAHLADEGYDVIYPRYESPPPDPQAREQHRRRRRSRARGRSAARRCRSSCSATRAAGGSRSRRPRS